MGRVAEKARVFLELVKFEHSIFALPYAYVGALYGAAAVVLPRVVRPLSDIWPWLGAADSRGYTVLEPTRWVTAEGLPTWSAVLWITVAMVGARSFAFVVNRAVDREIDARNPRTAGRAIPAGRVKTWEIWVFAVVVLAAYLVAVWQLAPVTRWLSPIPLVAFVVYPYTKRYTALCHYWLGLCLGLAPLGGWAGVGASLANPAPWILGAAVMLWTAGFDIIYATQDIECDVRDRVHSMPADYGIGKSLLQTRVDHALTVALLVAGGLFAVAGWPWYAGVAVAAVLLAYENSIVHADDLSRVNAAFFTVNGIIAIVVFAGALADRLLG